MKKMYTYTRLCILLSILSYSVNGQNPCTGTPSTNTMVPQNYTVCYGSAASLSLANTYSVSGITYQWYSSTTSLVGPYSIIPGANQSTYTSGTLTSNMFYQVIITCTNSGQSLTLNMMVTVLVCPCTGSPAASTIVPATHTICQGNVATMSLSPNYSFSGITYQWGTAPASTGPYVPISGGTQSVYTSPPLNSTLYYNVVVTCTNSNQSFTTTHTVSVLSCTYCSGFPGTNTVLPVSQTVCAGSVANMSLANTYSTSGITYQWQTSSISPVGPFSNIPGATSTVYTSPTLTSTTYYNVVITCTNGGQSISVPHQVTVINCIVPCSGVPASNTILPLSHTLCAGDVASMSLANSYSNSGIVYQWGTSGFPTGPFSAIGGASLSTYVSPPLNSSTYFNVTITCTNSGLSDSTTHMVTVLSCTHCSGTPGSNTVVPVNHTVCVGSPATMSLANTYTHSGMNYQWQRSTVSLVGPFTNIAGATSAIYSSPNLTTTTFFNVVITCSNSGLSIQVPHSVNTVTCAPNPVGMSALTAEEVKFGIFPNPGNGEFTIEATEGGTLQFLDVMGRVVLLRRIDATVTALSVRNLPNGVYYALFTTSRSVSVVKVMKE